MINKYSKHVTQDPNQPAAQAMLHAIGLTKADLLKPQIGIASTGWDGNPCNMHLNDLAKDIKTGVNAQDLVGLIFNTIGVSDGISMGTAGMRFSLPSRDIIADSVETVVSAQWYDGVIAVVGCDKNMPGALMALGRLNRPGIIVYGGTIAPGCHAGKNLDVVSAFEALGQKLSGEIDQVTFENVILKACPGAGELRFDCVDNRNGRVRRAGQAPVPAAQAGGRHPVRGRVETDPRTGQRDPDLRATLPSATGHQHDDQRPGTFEFASGDHASGLPDDGSRRRGWRASARQACHHADSVFAARRRIGAPAGNGHPGDGTA